MKRVLILGGGFGGLAAARQLRRSLSSEDEIVLVDRRPHFMVGFRKTWALVGESPLEAGQRPLADLERQGIRVLQAAVDRLDPRARTVEAGGQRLEADAIVVALGAELAPDAVPGFREHALNVYDPQEIPRAAEAVAGFREGRLVIGIFGAPYKCPPAPYEMALLIHSALRKRGARASLEVFTPQPMSLPILGPAGCDIIESRLAENGMTFLPNRKATGVEAGQVVFGGERRPFDLLLGVPPHRCPAVLKDSGLTGESGWVKVHPRTMETDFEGVYAAGDVVQVAMANGKPLPKAGVFAEAMGEVAAERIAAVFAGQPPQAVFGGQGGCYLEVGPNQAMMVQGHFLAEPEPEVILTEASGQLFEEKRAFETTRLNAWFG